jgi:hypothetical protein
VSIRDFQEKFAQIGSEKGKVFGTIIECLMKKDLIHGVYREAHTFIPDSYLMLKMRCDLKERYILVRTFYEMLSDEHFLELISEAYNKYATITTPFGLKLYIHPRIAKDIKELASMLPQLDLDAYLPKCFSEYPPAFKILCDSMNIILTQYSFQNIYLTPTGLNLLKKYFHERKDKEFIHFHNISETLQIAPEIVKKVYEKRVDLWKTPALLNAPSCKNSDQDTSPHVPLTPYLRKRKLFYGIIGGIRKRNSYDRYRLNCLHLIDDKGEYLVNQIELQAVEFKSYIPLRRRYCVGIFGRLFESSYYECVDIERPEIVEVIVERDRIRNLYKDTLPTMSNETLQKFCEYLYIQSQDIENISIEYPNKK